jgi:hypothetical protein
MSADPGTAAVLGASAGDRYEMFDVAAIDEDGARLVGPLLLEIGEEITLRLTRDERVVELRARITGVERAGGEAVSLVRFVDRSSPAP